MYQDQPFHYSFHGENCDHLTGFYGYEFEFCLLSLSNLYFLWMKVSEVLLLWVTFNFIRINTLHEYIPWEFFNISWLSPAIKILSRLPGAVYFEHLYNNFIERNIKYVSAHMNNENYFWLKDWIEGQMSYNWEQTRICKNKHWRSVSPKGIWTVNTKTTLVPFFVLVKATKSPLNIVTDVKKPAHALLFLDGSMFTTMIED